MADLVTTGTSGYATGSIDTATTLVNNVSPTDANHPNGIAAAAIQIETILGSGTTLKGAGADLGARLAVGMDSAGKLNLSTDAAINGPLNVAKGGTGVSTLTSTKVLLGDGTNTVAFGSGLIYQGPTSTGASSTAAHEGTVTISASQALSGIHFYTDFTLNAGQTLTIADDAGRLCICATGTITINGTIDGIGAGGQGGTGGTATAVVETHGGYAGGTGTSQPGGGGGGGGAGRGGDGGNGGASCGGRGGTTNTNGAQGTNNTGELLGISAPLGIYGGGGGGGGGSINAGAGGAGGNGGASIVLCAPTVTLGAASVLNTSGANGVNGAATNGGAGGGGGAGNVYVFCRSYTNNGATFTLTAGTGGTGNGTGGNGADGRAGIRQINIYA